LTTSSGGQNANNFPSRELRLTERIHSLTSVALLSSLAALFLIEQLRSIKTKIVTEAV